MFPWSFFQTKKLVSHGAMESDPVASAESSKKLYEDRHPFCYARRWRPMVQHLIQYQEVTHYKFCEKNK